MPEIEPQTESLEDIVKKFLDEYRDDENTYFPEDLWSLDNELKALIESEKAKSRREGEIFLLEYLINLTTPVKEFTDVGFNGEVVSEGFLIETKEFLEKYELPS